MTVNEAFHNGRRVEAWDSDAGTFTRWDADGNVLEHRPLTADEIAAMTPPPDPRAELLARLDDAVLLDEIRAVVADAIQGGVL